MQATAIAIPAPRTRASTGERPCPWVAIGLVVNLVRSGAFPGVVLNAVIGCFLRNGNIMGVALPHTGR